MVKVRRNNIRMIRDLTEREEEIKLCGREDLNSNSFVEINMFRKTEVSNVRK